MTEKTKEELIQEQLRDLETQRLIRDRIASSTRAMSVTVGTAFGGVTELSMRGDAGQNLWCLMQPVEVVELIHQLAANVGCHIALKPRKDFASWRDWRVTEEEQLAYNGWAPFVNDMAPYHGLGAKGMDPEVVKALEMGGKLNEEFGGAGGKLNGEVALARRGASFGGQPGASVFNPEAVKRSKQNAVATKKPSNKRKLK